jgi:predicted signal transduction protein with EAL and GGDEF domain
MGAMTAQHAALVRRLKAALYRINQADRLTLDELCQVVPIMEGAADRVAGSAAENVLTFQDCRRRARRISSGGQFTGAE